MGLNSTLERRLTCAAFAAGCVAAYASWYATSDMESASVPRDDGTKVRRNLNLLRGLILSHSSARPMVLCTMLPEEGITIGEFAWAKEEKSRMRKRLLPATAHQNEASTPSRSRKRGQRTGTGDNEGPAASQESTRKRTRHAGTSSPLT